jgi:Protein of unknown function (DUF3618)
MGPEQDPLVSDSPIEDTRSTSEIKSDIRRTRDRLDDTLENLNERLSPRSILNDILSWFESQGGKTSSGAADSLKRGFRGIIQQMKENPIPTVLIGTGIAAIVLRDDDDEDASASQDQASYGSGYSGIRASSGAGESQSAAYGQPEGSGPGSVIKEKAGEAREALSGGVEAAAEKMSDVGSDLRATALSGGAAISRGIHRSKRIGTDATQQFQQGYTHLRGRFGEAVEEYPLALAAGFVGIGLLTGLLLPRTRQEDKLMGEKADQLIEQAKETGKEALQKTKRVAQRVAESTLEEAKRQGLTPQATGDKIAEMAGKLGSVASQAKEGAIKAAEEEQLKPASGKKDEPEKTSEQANP